MREAAYYRKFGILIVVTALLTLNLSSFLRGMEHGSRAENPDFSIENIWMVEDYGVSCRIRLLSGEYYGTFTVNLTFWGEVQQTIYHYWMTAGDTMNVTFETWIPWNVSRVEVGIELEFQAWEMEQNKSNNIREEIWYRDLPDLYIRSLFRVPETNEVHAYVGNRGTVEINDTFEVDLKVNGSIVSTIDFYQPIPAGEELDVSMLWIWNTSRSPIDIEVIADLENHIEEMDDTDNSYSITWEHRPRLYFDEGPDLNYSHEPNNWD